MKELEMLLNERWILKSRDRAAYYQVRDSLPALRGFLVEKLGCRIIENSYLVKLEKIPALPSEGMGILHFTSPKEYAMFCILLMYLEDKDAQTHFALSMLTEYMETELPVQTVDWTDYKDRKSLIAVLRFSVEAGLLDVTDGSDEHFLDDENEDVLYQNTGMSRYFMRMFHKDISQCTRPEDIEESEWLSNHEDIGVARRHRVYKRLIFSPALYKEAGNAEDFEYVKYYGRRLESELEEKLGCRLHIHKGGAFLLQEEGSRMGAVFPDSRGISDMILLVLAAIRQKVEGGQWLADENDTVTVTRMEFEDLIRMTRQEYGAGLTKELRNMSWGKFLGKVYEEMRNWMFMQENGDTVRIGSLAGKIEGHFPAEYVNRQKEGKSE